MILTEEDRRAQNETCPTASLSTKIVNEMVWDRTRISTAIIYCKIPLLLRT